MLPAGVGVAGAFKVIAAREQVARAGAEIESDMLGFLARIATPMASFGLATTGSVLLVIAVLATLAHRAALEHRGLNLHEGSSGRAMSAAVAGACVAVVVLFLRRSAPSPCDLAVGATCVVAGVGAGLLAHRIHLLALVSDIRERPDWLWRNNT